jgi:hypothetical protein
MPEQPVLLRRLPHSRRWRPALDGPLPAAAVTLIVHVLLLAWILQAGRPTPNAAAAHQDTRLWVEWLQAEPALTEPPPMPQAPSRPNLRSARTPTAAPLAPSPTPALDSSHATEPLATPADSSNLFAPGRLIDRIHAQLDDSGRVAAPAEGASLERPPPRLPGREDAIVEGFYVREEASPADVVAMVGSLFGGAKGATCTDLRGKIMSDISDAERRRLIDDERRICRRGRAETYR